MIKEQEEIIKEIKTYIHNYIMESFDDDGYTQYKISEEEQEFFNNIETVLNMLKEKDKYIKDANDITTEMSNDIKKLTSELEKKDKIIDLMAFNLADYVMYYDYDKCRNPEMIKNKAKEIKQYFAEKATNNG